MAPEFQDPWPPTTIPRIAFVTIAFSIGIGAGALSPVTSPAWGLGGAVLALTTLTLRRGRSAHVSAVLAGLVVVGLGAARFASAERRAAPRAVAAHIGGEERLVRVRGLVLRDARSRTRDDDPLRRFGVLPETFEFSLDIDRVLDTRNRARALSGRVRVVADALAGPVPAGSIVEITGVLARPERALNPGERDARRAAHERRMPATLYVRSARHVQTIRAPGPTPWRGQLRAHRAAIQQCARDALIAPIPQAAQRRRALLSALLLGWRDGDDHDLHEAFRDVGLAHVLALSGLHLGLVLAMIGAAARRVVRSRRVTGMVLLAAIAAFLTVIEVRLPVIRAATLAGAVALGMLCGRRWRLDGLLAASALGLLVWRPHELFSAGFQLSFGVVLALVTLAAPLRARWYGPPVLSPPTAGAVLREHVATALTSAFVAWIVASPLIAYHFGLFTPFAVLLSVISLPLVSALLALGYLQVLVTFIAPALATSVLAPLAAVLAETLLAIVDLTRRAPAATMHLAQPPAWLCAGVLVLIVAWLVPFRPPRGLRVTRIALSGAAIAWIVVIAAFGGRHASRARLDTLAVGDGSCHVLRSDGHTALIDAGSLNRPAVGQRIVVPALRRLGVRRLAFVVITHADLDHFAGVWDVLRAFPVGRVLVTRQFILEALDDARGAAAALLEDVRSRGVPVIVTARDHVELLGACTVQWLHPARHDRYADANDASTCLRIRAGGRHILLTGDLGPSGLATLSRRTTNLGPIDVLELPHHGSWNPESARFVDALRPWVVVQSTGARRLEDDRWAGILPEGTTRYVTQRDGAVSISIGRDESISVATFSRERPPS